MNQYNSQQQGSFANRAPYAQGYSQMPQGNTYQPGQYGSYTGQGSFGGGNGNPQADPRYPAAEGNYSQNGYGSGAAAGPGGYFGGYPSGAGQGAGMGQNTYPAQASGNWQPAQGYPVEGYPNQNAQYGYTATGQGGNQQGSYIPQTPYQPSGKVQGYNAGGAPYGQAYMPYGPNGQNSGLNPAAGYGTMNQQIPMNTAGYTPPKNYGRKSAFRLDDTSLIILSLLLLILFAVGMFVESLAFLRWVFLGAAALSVIALWIKPMVDQNKRLVFTVAFSVLCLVTAVGLAQSGSTDKGREPASVQNTHSTGSQYSSASGGAAGSVASAYGSGMPAATAAPAETTAPPEGSSATDRLATFFTYWGANKHDEMLTLCLPSWQSSVSNPKAALFGLMANRTPQDYNYESITGTNDDKSRTVTITSTMDRNNGKPPVKYRLNIRMVNENDEWYVDPQSLKSYENADTPDPAAQATATPAPTQSVDARTVLYYNPDGGTKYHLDPNCKSTHEKYLPMKGHFTYAQINDPQYANLKPCNVCAAPLRE